MADAIAKREARRKRILENSENRLQRITGKYKESTEDKYKNDLIHSKPQIDNGYITSKSASAAENKAILEEKHKNFLEQDNNSDIQEFEYFESNDKQSDNHFTINHSDHLYSLKEERKNCDTSNSIPTVTLLDQVSGKQSHDSSFSSLFFSSLSCVFLAAFVNILYLASVDFSLYKGIIIPYIIMAITRLCLGNKSEESKGSSMLVAALILCNIKPEIVHSLKKVLALCSSTSKDFALYLTSFVLFNWIISICWANLSHVLFF